MTFGRTLEANAHRLSPLKRSALVNLGLGVTFMTAHALAREGLATISVSGCGSWDAAEAEDCPGRGITQPA